MISLRREHKRINLRIETCYGPMELGLTGVQAVELGVTLIMEATRLKDEGREPDPVPALPLGDRFHLLEHEDSATFELPVEPFRALETE